MLILSSSHISKTYIVDSILEDISFNVNDKDKIGLIGLNGTGKTTLLDILADETDKDSGDLYIQKGLKIGYLKQYTKIDSKNTIIEECLTCFTHLIKMEENLRNLEEEMANESNDEKRLAILMEEYGSLSEDFSGSNGYGYKSEIKGVLKGLGFLEEDFNKIVNILSGGQKSRLELAKLLLKKPDLLLLDEPTNHLDIDAVIWLEKYIKEYPGTAIIISHDRYFLNNVVNRIFYLENKKLHSYNTDYSGFMKQRKNELEVLKRQYEDQQKEIKRQEEIIKRFKNYGDSRYIKQAQSREKLLDKMKVIDPEKESKKTRLRFEPSIKSGNDVLKVNNIYKSFDDNDLLKNINFNIYSKEKVGLLGANGIGKTTLFKIVLGQVAKDSGEVVFGHNVFPGYFDQEMETLNLDNTVMDEIWEHNPKFTYYDIRTVLSQFLFIGDDILKEIKDLSGGERARLSLLKLMLSKANFLLLDEPTNHLDIDSKEVLEDALNEYEGTIFVISHDRYFLNRVTDKTLELTEEGIQEYLGNYDYYIEKKKELEIVEEEENYKTKTQVRLEKKKEREQLIFSRNKRKRLIALEEEIDNLENQLAEIDNMLSDNDIYNNHEKVVEITQKREKISGNLETLYEEWMDYHNK